MLPTLSFLVSCWEDLVFRSMTNGRYGSVSRGNEGGVAQRQVEIYTLCTIVQQVMDLTLVLTDPITHDDRKDDLEVPPA